MTAGVAAATRRPIAGPLEWVRPPQQARSQRTLERILDAAEKLIEDRGAEKTTVSAIVREAGSSVGSFYARFGDKETLLRCLNDRFYRQAEATVEAALDPARWHGVGMRDALRASLVFTAGVFKSRHRLIAALARQAAGADELEAPAKMVGARITTKLIELGRVRGEEVAHPEPERATALCVWMILSALTSWAEGGADPESPAADIETFADDLTEICFGYLFSPRN